MKGSQKMFMVNVIWSKRLAMLFITKKNSVREKARDLKIIDAEVDFVEYTWF